MNFNLDEYKAHKPNDSDLGKYGITNCAIVISTIRSKKENEEGNPKCRSTEKQIK